MTRDQGARPCRFRARAARGDLECETSPRLELVAAAIARMRNSRAGMQ